MSNLVFPTLAGLSPDVSRTRLDNNSIYETAGGKEQRLGRWSRPRYRYKLGFSFLRSASAFQELQAIENFAARHRGRFDSFLWADPEDSSVADHGFGVGDGVTTAFQLQRTMGGSYSDALGTYASGSKPRTNLLLQSSQVGSAPNWSANANGAVVPDMVLNSAAAPDGTVNGTIVSFPAVAANSGNSTFAQIYQGIALKAGTTYTFSAWVRKRSGTASTLMFRWYCGSPVYFGLSRVNQPVTSTWTRVTSTFAPPVDGTWFPIFGGEGGDPVLGQQDVVVELWGCQLEAGAAATQYIPTNLTAVTQNPAYWPAIGDGLEPVFDLNGPATIFRDGDWRGRCQLSPISRTNLFPYSQTLSNAAWTKGFTSINQRTNYCSYGSAFNSWGPTNATVTANTLLDPSGLTLTSDTISEGVANGQHYVLSGSAIPASAAQVYLSCYVKPNTCTKVRLGSSAPDYGYADFDLSGGGSVITSSGVATQPSIAAVGGGWFRIWFQYTGTNGAAPPWLQLLSATAQASYTGTSRTIYAWGAQQEFGMSGYIDTPGGAAVTVTDAQVAAPDGSSTADWVREGVTNQQHYLQESVSGFVAGRTYTISVYAKVAALSSPRRLAMWIGGGGAFASQGVNFDLATGAISNVGQAIAGSTVSGSIVAAGGGWYRLAITAPCTASGGDYSGFYFSTTDVFSAAYGGDGLSGFYLWGFQAEAGATPTAQIPTTTVAVTQPADYSVGTLGVVTMAAAPPAGAVLSWSGSYWKRVRFAEDSLSSDRIVQQMWKAAQVELETVG
jgi:hypothetical protein